jgi:hypothetical protein
MNEFDNFVKEDEYKKALEKSHVHIADLRKMETIDFMNLVSKPRLSEVERKIQTQIFLANVRALLKNDMDIEKKALHICALAKVHEEVVK